MYKKKKVIALMMLLVMFTSGCSFVGLGLSSSTDRELTNGTWEAVNTDKVKAYNG